MFLAVMPALSPTGIGCKVDSIGPGNKDGKYKNLTEDQQPAMFLPLLQSPASWIWLVVRSSRDPQQLAAAMRSVLRDIDPGMVLR
jgi:hypothetical protein